ncbi:hypothetical protein [Streptomyces malaysiensis]|uniref:hypothetical protein n=1 Tax=Streptomyces malaysiensis TaxID=92644 RepID=UPI00114CAB34|nr:hypothetical protein [Streptomyces sp. SPMA113]
MGTIDSWIPDWTGRLPDLEVVPIPDEAKDEFIFHVFAAMREFFDYGYSSNTRTDVALGSFEEFKLNTSHGRELPRLWVINLSGALLLSLAGKEQQTEEDIDAWRQAIVSGISRMGSRDDFTWTAILSQKQSNPYRLDGQRLSKSSTTGTLNFNLLGPCISEDSPVAMPGSGIVATEYVHWPIKICGSTPCYSWDGDGDTLTLQRLRRIAGILSLWWDNPWTIREGPRSPEIQHGAGRDALMGKGWRPVTDNELSNTGRPISIPEWLETVERRVSDSNRLTAAILIHHEGLQLTRDHSSMALVCFIAAIEATAQVNKKPTRCPKCKMVTGSTQRFKEAVQSVLGDERAATLSDAYSKRSLTVHQGRLHGTELRANSFGGMSLFMPDSLFNFTAATVKTAQEASRLLLLKKIGVTDPSA